MKEEEVNKDLLNLAGNKKLSIEEAIDRANWLHISKYQKLSEGFIREFEDKVDWLYISIYQKLSEDFIKEFEDRVIK